MKRGFTFMELLVVIAIIGIMTALAAASYMTAQKQSRDQRRIGDMKAIQNAWEQYFSDNSQNYPSSCSQDMSVYLPGGTPIDPKTKVSYLTSATCTISSYCICASLEQSGKGNATNASCSYVAGGYYCVSNVQ